MRVRVFYQRSIYNLTEDFIALKRPLYDFIAMGGDGTAVQANGCNGFTLCSKRLSQTLQRTFFLWALYLMMELTHFQYVS